MILEQAIKGSVQDLTYNPETFKGNVDMNNEIFKEDDVVLKYIAELEKEGCTIEDYCIGHKHGIDIIATTKDGVKIIVEAKGTQNGAKSSMNIAFEEAFGQLILRNHILEENTVNIILLPLNKYYLSADRRSNSCCSLYLR